MARVVAILAVVFGVLAAVIMSERPLPDADMRVIIPLDFFTLDPQRTQYNHDIRLSYSIWETLLRYDTESEDFHVVPGLAREWTVSDDGVTYRFDLHPDAKWSNGEPVVASDLVYAWRRALLPETASAYSGMFFVLKGGREFFDWRTAQLEEYALRPESERTMGAAKKAWDEAQQRFADTVGVRAEDDHTLVVTLERPTAYFPDLCAFAVFAPVYPPLVDRYLRIDPATGRLQQGYDWTKPPLLVTNGPYTPTMWKFKRGLAMERNPHFRDPSLAKMDSIVFIPVVDLNTSVLAFQTGAGDFHTDVRVDYLPEMLEEVRRGERDDFHAFGTFGTYFWGFNCTPTLADGRVNPFADARVRRAFVMATDKDELINRVRRSGEVRADVLIPPGSIGGFQSPKGLPYDVDRARAELTDAGWIDRDGDGLVENEQGEPFPVVEMLYTTAGYHKNIALAMGRMWEKALGVRTKMVAKETKVYKDDLDARNYMVARAGWFGDYGDPTTFLNLHRTGDGNNDRGYSDPVFDDLMDRSDAEADPEKRMRLLEEAERYTMEETVPVLPIFQYNWYYLFEPPERDGKPNPGGLANISFHPRLVQYYWKLEVVR